MKKLLLSFVFVFTVCVSAYTQNTVRDSLYNKSRLIGYGISNFLDLIDPINYKPGIYLEFGQPTPMDNWNLKISFIGKYSYQSQNNLRQHSILPFVFTAGLERNWYFDKVLMTIDFSLYYSMSVRKATTSAVQSDDYGVGVAPGILLQIPLRDDLVLCGGVQIGGGLYREFAGVGTVARPTIVGRIEDLRLFSFGLRHYF